MQFETDRPRDSGGEPSLSQMTAKAIDVLARAPKGFFLMVEGGRIDHGHHAGNAYRALTETIEFSNAVRVALAKTDPKQTLIVVTADHGHVFTFGGYAKRGNPILGKVVHADEDGAAGASEPARDLLGLPYTTLGYLYGPGYTGASNEQAEGPKHFPHRPTSYRAATQGRPDLDGGRHHRAELPAGGDRAAPERDALGRRRSGVCDRPGRRSVPRRARAELPLPRDGRGVRLERGAGEADALSASAQVAVRSSQVPVGVRKISMRRSVVSVATFEPAVIDSMRSATSSFTGKKPPLIGERPSATRSVTTTATFAPTWRHDHALPAAAAGTRRDCRCRRRRRSRAGW